VTHSDNMLNQAMKPNDQTQEDCKTSSILTHHTTIQNNESEP